VARSGTNEKLQGEKTFFLEKHHCRGAMLAPSPIMLESFVSLLMSKIAKA